MWLPIHHEKYDSRKGRDAEQDTDLCPIHPPTVRNIEGLLLGANRRKTDWRGGSQSISRSCQIYCSASKAAVALDCHTLRSGGTMVGLSYFATIGRLAKVASEPTARPRLTRQPPAPMAGATSV
jgi:hypothetical protein